MSIEEKWGNFFKAEIKSSGLKLFTQEKVSLTSATDTTIHAFVKAAPPLKVVLSSEGIASHLFTAECSCPAGKKSQFCKHIWATLLSVAQKYPDFLTLKRVIEKSTSPLDTVQDAHKQRASEYRKEQYQKQKAQVKKEKRERESAVDPEMFPEEIATALRYFSLNGFPMPAGPSESVLSEAKRKLSRVFHPDKGGSHSEIIELNRHWETLMHFLGL
jgi:uncharacterized Zn finger protein